LSEVLRCRSDREQQRQLAQSQVGEDAQGELWDDAAGSAAARTGERQHLRTLVASTARRSSSPATTLLLFLNIFFDISKKEGGKEEEEQLLLRREEL